MSNSFPPPGPDQGRPEQQPPYGAPEGPPAYGQFAPPQGAPAYGQPGGQDVAPGQYGDQGQYGQAPYGDQGQYGQAPYGDQGQYGQAPYGQQYGGPGYYAPAPVVRPPSIDKAVLLMKIGAGLSILSGLLLLAMRGPLREATEKAVRDQGTNLTPAEIDSAVTVAQVAGVVGALIGAGLWWLMAVKNRQGKSWARILSTVFFGISLFQTFYALAQPSSGSLGWALTVVQLLVGAGAVFFLWQKDSSRYFEESARPV